MSTRLVEPKINKERAERIAHQFVRERIGNIPNITEAVLEGKNWIIPIDVSYPKVFLNKEGMPIKTRFIKIPNVGKVEISSENGTFVDYPKSWSIENQIENGLLVIKNAVEKALVKVGARNFSILPFSEHRYTPILDILATLLTEEKFYLSDLVVDDQVSKYRGYLGDLAKIGLVRITQDYVIPGNLFTILDERLGTDAKNSERLTVLLTLFFERGYEYISSVKSVLGSHLELGGFVYQESFEYGGLLSFTKDDITVMIDNVYKNVKIPRYLVQLEKIGVLEEDKSLGKSSWKPNDEVFEKFTRESTILEPVSRMMSSQD